MKNKVKILDVITGDQLTAWYENKCSASLIDIMSEDIALIDLKGIGAVEFHIDIENSFKGHITGVNVAFESNSEYDGESVTTYVDRYNEHVAYPSDIIDENMVTDIVEFNKTLLWEIIDGVDELWQEELKENDPLEYIKHQSY